MRENTPVSALFSARYDSADRLRAFDRRSIFQRSEQSALGLRLPYFPALRKYLYEPDFTLGSASDRRNGIAMEAALYTCRPYTSLCEKKDRLDFDRSGHSGLYHKFYLSADARLRPAFVRNRKERILKFYTIPTRKNDSHYQRGTLKGFSSENVGYFRKNRCISPLRCKVSASLSEDSSPAS